LSLQQVLQQKGQSAPEKLGFGRAVAASLLIHFGALAALVVFGLARPPKDLPPAVSVGVVSRLPTKAAGAKKKGAVSRSNEQKKAPPKKEKAPDPNKKEIGLAKKTETKPKKSEKAAPEPAPPGPLDDKKPLDTGGTGGTAERGATLDMASLGDPNAVPSEFGDYYATILAEISNHWLRGSFTGNNPVVTFSVQRDGQVRDAFVSESSGQAFLDSPALRAVLAARFPPLPQGYREDAMLFHVRFRYGD
jgi:TonB family protein